MVIVRLWMLLVLLFCIQDITVGHLVHHLINCLSRSCATAMNIKSGSDSLVSESI